MIPYVGAGFAGLPSSTIPAELDVAFGGQNAKSRQPNRMSASTPIATDWQTSAQFSKGP